MNESPIWSASGIGFAKVDKLGLNGNITGPADVGSIPDAVQYDANDSLTTNCEKSPAGSPSNLELLCTNNSGANTGLSPTRK